MQLDNPTIFSNLLSDFCLFFQKYKLYMAKFLDNLNIQK